MRLDWSSTDSGFNGLRLSLDMDVTIVRSKNDSFADINTGDVEESRVSEGAI